MINYEKIHSKIVRQHETEVHSDQRTGASSERHVKWQEEDYEDDKNNMGMFMSYF